MNNEIDIQNEDNSNDIYELIFSNKKTYQSELNCEDKVFSLENVTIIENSKSETDTSEKIKENKSSVIDNLDETKKTLEENELNYKQTIDELKNKLENFENINKNIENLINQKNEKLKKLENENEKLNNKIKENENLIKDKNDEISKLKNEKDSFYNENLNYEDKVSSLENLMIIENTKSEKKISMKDDEIKKHIEKLNRVNEELNKKNIEIFKIKQDKLKIMIQMGAVIFMLFGIIYFQLANPVVNKNNNNNNNSINQIALLDSNKLLNRLKNEFPSQTKDFYSIIMSSYEESILKKNDPSIIILISDKRMKSNLNCVSKKLMNILNEASHGRDRLQYDSLIISTNNLFNMNAEDAKKYLDESLINIFTNLKGRIALVEDINKIPAESMLLFYTYGDDASTAKYKGVIIFLTYELDKEVSKNDEIFNKLLNDYSKLSKFVQKEITAKWSADLSYDKLSPLFTRIGNQYILLNNEENC